VALVLCDSTLPGEPDAFAFAAEVRRRPELARATLMMLSAADRRAELARCRECGVAAYLSKPIRQSDLLDAIVSLLGSELTDDSPPPPSVRGSAIERCEHSLRVLLAEDNAVNQKLAVRLLEKRGHSAAVVSDGQAALEALERETFDAVLMDVQMPGVDGFEATRRIRAREAGTGRRLPIIAMTAHAMKGDRERCLAVGMDGYVTKPIQVEQLFQVLEGFTAPAPPTPEPTTPSAPVFDVQAALARARGDRALLAELIELFRGECEQARTTLRGALERRDAGALRLASHSLKGAAANLGASAVADAAQRLELLGKDEQLGGAEDAYRALTAALDDLRPVLLTCATNLAASDAPR